MVSKKDLKKQVDELSKRLEQANEFSKTEIGKYSQQLIQLKATIDAANAAMKIGGDITKEAEELSMFNQIMKNQLPTELAWPYWQWINDKTLYWLNRYTKFDAPEGIDRDEVINAKWIAIMYGKSVYYKKDNLAYSISKIDEKYIWGIPAGDVLNDQNYYTKKDGKWGINDTAKAVALDKDQCVVYTWRFGNIGNFVWYLMYGCLYLTTMLMVPSNASMLVNKLFYKVNDLNAFKNESRKILNPLSNIVPIVADKTQSGGGSNLLGETNKILESKFQDAKNIEQIIMATKFLNETLCNEFGIRITSAKEQALSADANMSASASALIAYEHDRRMIEADKKLGITLIINEPDVIEPENENADKEGTGFAKTDGDEINQKGGN